MKHPQSYSFLINPGNTVTVSFSSKGCDRLRATVITDPTSNPVRYRSNSTAPDQDITLNAGSVQLVDVGFNTASTNVDLIFNPTAGYVTPVFATPRLHCAVNALSQS